MYCPIILQSFIQRIMSQNYIKMMKLLHFPVFLLVFCEKWWWCWLQHHRIEDWGYFERCLSGNWSPSYNGVWLNVTAITTTLYILTVTQEEEEDEDEDDDDDVRVGIMLALRIYYMVYGKRVRELYERDRERGAERRKRKSSKLRVIKNRSLE